MQVSKILLSRRDGFGCASAKNRLRSVARVAATPGDRHQWQRVCGQIGCFKSRLTGQAGRLPAADPGGRLPGAMR